MTSDKSRKTLPPYISYRTFENFLERLQQQVPSRIDRSYWGETLSGSTGTQLMSALRFLNLIDGDGKPSNRLRMLVSTRGEQKKQVLREIIPEAYDFVLQSSLDIQNATYAQLEEAFHDNFQLTTDVCRKCIKFFVSLAAEAGMTLSPFMTKRFRWARATSGAAGRGVPKRMSQRLKRNAQVPDNSKTNAVNIPLSSIQSSLLDKFPAFDPAWNDDVKLKWFTAFDELLKRYPSLQ